jgi:hypothetical protein
VESQTVQPGKGVNLIFSTPKEGLEASYSAKTRRRMAARERFGGLGSRNESGPTAL